MPNTYILCLQCCLGKPAAWTPGSLSRTTLNNRSIKAAAKAGFLWGGEGLGEEKLACSPIQFCSVLPSLPGPGSTSHCGVCIGHQPSNSWGPQRGLGPLPYHFAQAEPDPRTLPSADLRRRARLGAVVDGLRTRGAGETLCLLGGSSRDPSKGGRGRLRKLWGTASWGSRWEVKV